MANNKHRGTAQQLNAQRQRTYKNQAKRYENLLAQFPTHKHASNWKKQLEFFSKGPELRK